MVRTRSLLAGKRALFALSLLGLVTGIVVGCVIIIFRFSTEYMQMSFLPAADPENYEALNWQAGFLFFNNLWCIRTDSVSIISPEYETI
ncbi:MAG: hypothetical protein O7D86_10515 [Proteobacteria bacterium]|nr:hypothetical protein [Pseudomonadota bacterium]